MPLKYFAHKFPKLLKKAARQLCSYMKILLSTQTTNKTIQQTIKQAHTLNGWDILIERSNPTHTHYTQIYSHLLLHQRSSFRVYYPQYNHGLACELARVNFFGPSRSMSSSHRQSVEPIRPHSAFKTVTALCHKRVTKSHYIAPSPPFIHIVTNFGLVSRSRVLFAWVLPRSRPPNERPSSDDFLFYSLTRQHAEDFSVCKSLITASTPVTLAQPLAVCGVLVFGGCNNGNPEETENCKATMHNR